MKVFITGAEGFVGGHLIDHLVARGHVVYGTTYSEGLIGSHIPSGVDIRQCDILDADSIARLLAELQPEGIVHLAAVSSVSIARSRPAATAQVNILGAFNVLQAASELGHKPKVLLVSTSEVYGSVAESLCPITEHHPVQPQSIYAASKASAEVLATFFERSREVPVIIVRPFNHTGPRQAPTFVCSAFARQIAQIEAGLVEPVIHVGNLEARRDFLDVRDVAHAYTLALDKAKSGVIYNICSGRAVSIGEILEMLLSLSDMKIDVEISKDLLRPLDIPLLVGSHDRFTEATGWVPTVPLAETLEALLMFWRGRVG